MTDFNPPKRPTVSLAVARELLLVQMRELHSGVVDPRLVAPLMLWGPPGIGKSDLIRTLCEEHGWGFVDVRLAQRDPVDLRGLPVPSGDTVRWLPSSEWPRDATSRGILLFDELTAADRTLQVAAYEILLDRRLGDTYSVPRGWLVCGAGNRAEDASVSVPMSAALANRFLHLDLGADLAAWTAWARTNGVRDDVIAFLRARPALLLDMARSDLQRGWPSPRSWARVSSFLEASADLSRAAERAGLAGLVGEGAAVELMAFREATRGLPDLDDVVRGVTRIDPLPTAPDQLYALVTGLARVVWAADDRDRAIGILLHLGAELDADFAATLVADTLTLAPAGAAAAVVEHPAMTRLRDRHGAVFLDRTAPSPALPEHGFQSTRRRRRQVPAS